MTATHPNDLVDATSALPIRHAGGGAIPRLGLGVFRAGAGAGTRDAVRWALDAGYRHIDTAAVYRNEREVGAAIRQSGVPRAEVFVTTKLWREDYGRASTPRALEESLGQLGLDYVDLYLMHWPSPETRVETWAALVELRERGLCRAIGVSNFTAAHLDALIDATAVTPAVNQIELHPFLQQRALVQRCADRGVLVEAWAPLTKAQRLADPTLLAVADEVARTTAQVLIRWSLQKGYIVIPKSSSPTRIVENAGVFDFNLSAQQMARIDALDEGYRTAPGWDPSTVD